MDKFTLELAKAVEELALEKGMNVRDLLEVALEILKEKEAVQNKK